MISLSIFVHCASDYLTDCESHGEGLICFSLLNGLAKRGHRIFAYTKRAAISRKHPYLEVNNGGQHRVPFDSLAPWEHSWKADRWLSNLSNSQQINLVWRMPPYGGGCPTVPKTLGKPLVIGPLFYEWPQGNVYKARPRYGIGIQGLISPLAKQGWHNTLKTASLIIACTPKQVDKLQNKYQQAQGLCLPVIVDPPCSESSLIRRPPDSFAMLRLVFVANLVPWKNPLIFCEAVKLLRDNGISVQGVFLGDGQERSSIETYIRLHGLEDILLLKGKVPSYEVYQYLSEADILVSASLGEPYGRSIVEAMSVGTPCICHNSGGPGEIIEHQIDGLLVPDLNAKAFANSIANLRVSPQLWERLSKNAIRKAKSWRSEVVLSSLEESLLKLVND